MSPNTIDFMLMTFSVNPLAPAGVFSTKLTKSSMNPSTEKTVVASRLVRNTTTASGMNIDRTSSQSGTLPPSNETMS